MSILMIKDSGVSSGIASLFIGIALMFFGRVILKKLDLEGEEFSGAVDRYYRFWKPIKKIIKPFKWINKFDE